MAYSGGRDSTALLHATARAALELCALGIRTHVVGLHVHHGLSPRADAWLAHCQRQCAAWAADGLPLSLAWHRLDGTPARGESIEAWARQGRYRALEAMAAEAGADLLLLAHHRRDQAETLLLQALRGGGVAGLAGMPQCQRRGSLTWLRPWLEQPSEAIDAYVAAHGLAHVEDDSNSDERLARNRLRRRVWPVLTQAFEHAETSLAQAAAWAQHSLALQQELALEDAGRWLEEGALPLNALEQLSPARAGNLLRYWLQQQLGHPPPASLVRRLLDEAGAAANGARWPAAHGWLQRHADRLTWIGAPPARRGGASPGPVLPELDLSRIGRHACPQWGGGWLVAPAAPDQPGVPASLLRNVRLRAREGGEQFQRAAGTPPRSLKKSWQAAGVPALLRDGPLLHGDCGLIHVPGLGLDARACALPTAAGEQRLVVQWQRGEAGG